MEPTFELRLGIFVSMVGKSDVREYWDAASCGEVYAEGDSLGAQLTAQADARYRLEPYIADFAGFADGAGRDVLEVGIGMGADHAEWAKHVPSRLVGIDFSSKAAEWTRKRLDLAELRSGLTVGDAENLPFSDETFDLVYSWGVIHHTPDTARAFREIHRVLRPGGEARVMIYHRRSVVGAMLWARYGLATGHPRRSLNEIYAHHLESPGTQAFTVEDAPRHDRGVLECHGNDPPQLRRLA